MCNKLHAKFIYCFWGHLEYDGHIEFEEILIENIIITKLKCNFNVKAMVKEIFLPLSLKFLNRNINVTYLKNFKK